MGRSKKTPTTAAALGAAKSPVKAAGKNSPDRPQHDVKTKTDSPTKMTHPLGTIGQTPAIQRAQQAEEDVPKEGMTSRGMRRQSSDANLDSQGVAVRNTTRASPGSDGRPTVPQGDDKAMRIQVKTVAGKSLFVTVKDTDTIGEVKQRVDRKLKENPGSASAVSLGWQFRAAGEKISPQSSPANAPTQPTVPVKPQKLPPSNGVSQTSKGSLSDKASRVDANQIPSVLKTLQQQQAENDKKEEKDPLVPQTFRWCRGGRAVYVQGTFNEWSESVPMTPTSDAEFHVTIPVKAGPHQFKYIVDGQWLHDPDLPTNIDKDGNVNNTVVVAKAPKTGRGSPPAFHREWLKIMSFNIRYDNDGDGANRWVNRKDIVASTIRFQAPDLCGLQEPLQHQIADLAAALPGYEWFGQGRDDGQSAGEYSPIMWRKSKFRRVDAGMVWLSTSPHTPGSKSWDAALPRIMTWVQLELRDMNMEPTGHYLFHFNTHFDHLSDWARTESANLLREKIPEIIRTRSVGSVQNLTDANYILTGDFNAGEDSDAYQTITRIDDASSERAYLKDSRYCASHVHNPSGTMTGFSAVLEEGNHFPTIDYIFCSRRILVDQFGVICETWHGRRPSDHRPIAANTLLAWGGAVNL